MAGGVNPFGFTAGIIPAPRAPRQPQDLPSAPFGFAPPPSKMQQTLAILNEYNPLPAFERLLKSPMALGGPISEQDIADGLMVSGTVTGGSAAAPKPKNALNMGIRAYHGSPHDFDRFDMSKIGTGEGAQAYGHGLYFAEKEGVAKSYRDALSGKQYKFNADPADISAKYGEDIIDVFYKYEGDPKEIGGVISGLRQAVQRDLAEFGVSDVSQLKSVYDGDLASKTIRMSQNADKLESLVKSDDIVLDPGKMYEVNINADPDTFLDWDKPLSEQPEAVRRALEANIPEYKTRNIAGVPHVVANNRMIEVNDPNLTGRDAYILSRMGQPGELTREQAAAASSALREAGIPGIKYLDAGSRGAGDGTRNYVVFDDRLIEIVRKYGIAGASAMLGYNILDGMDPAQAEELKRIEGNQ